MVNPYRASEGVRKFQGSGQLWEAPNVLPVSLERVIFNPIKRNTIKKNPMKEQELKKDHLLPGQMVSADNYRISQVGRRPSLLRGFTLSMNLITTFQLMKLLYLTRERRRLRHWQVLFVSLTRLTKTSPLHRKIYSDFTLDWDMLGSNMFNS